MKKTNIYTTDPQFVDVDCTKLGSLSIVVNVVSTIRTGLPKSSIPIEARDFIPVQSVQPSSGYHRTSSPTGTECKDFASCYMEML